MESITAARMKFAQQEALESIKCAVRDVDRGSIVTARWWWRDAEQRVRLVRQLAAQLIDTSERGYQ